MRFLLVAPLVVLFADCGSVLAAPTTAPVDDETVARRIDDTFARAARYGAAEERERRTLWNETAVYLLHSMGEDSPLLSDVRAAISSDAEQKDAAASLELVRALKQVRDDLRFTPRREAAMPPGFPEPAPVGRVVIADYPAYRAAFVAEPQTGQNGMFFKLFDHIKANNVTMTAPVEMSYAGDNASDKQPTTRPVTMAFLYERPDQGKTGDFDGVTVRDVPAVKVLSMGVRGRITDSDVAKNFAVLRDQLSRRPEWKAAGPPRVLGYNSPFNLPANMFYEVQLPIIATEK